MENSSINQVWKKLSVSSAFDPGKLSTKEYVEDDITTVRKLMDRRGYMSVVALICDLGLCSIRGYECVHGQFSWPRVFNLLLFGLLGIIILIGWWRARRWEKAETYMNTKDYLSLSARSIRAQILVMKRMFWGFYVFLIIGNLVIFFGGKSLIQEEIFLVVSILCGIGWLKARSYMKKTIAFYTLVVDRIDEVYINLTSGN